MKMEPSNSQGGDQKGRGVLTFNDYELILPCFCAIMAKQMKHVLFYLKGLHVWRICGFKTTE